MKNDRNKIEPEKKSEESNEQVVQLNEKYLRALADYQNLQKQTENWRDEFTKYASSGLIRKLLEVLDDLEKAQEHINDEGLGLTISKLQSILTGEGLEEIELEGKEFDPNVSEVVSTQPFDPAQGKPGEQSNIIVKVLQKGYKLKDKVIRPAKVTVSVIPSGVEGSDQK